MDQKLHLGVYGVLINDEKLLVVRKARGPYAGLFDLPGGRPHPGESLEEALKREFIEETAITLARTSWLTNVAITLDKLYHVALIYRIEEADLSLFDASIVFEDVMGATFQPLDSLTKSNSSPLILAALGFSTPNQKL